MDLKQKMEELSKHVHKLELQLDTQTVELNSRRSMKDRLEQLFDDVWRMMSLEERATDSGQRYERKWRRQELRLAFSIKEQEQQCRRAEQEYQEAVQELREMH